MKSLLVEMQALTISPTHVTKLCPIANGKSSVGVITAEEMNVTARIPSQPSAQSICRRVVLMLSKRVPVVASVEEIRTNLQFGTLMYLPETNVVTAMKDIDREFAVGIPEEIVQSLLAINGAIITLLGQSAYEQYTG
jgi:hypothetical protein